MKPFGHTNARGERTSLNALDLLPVWEAFMHDEIRRRASYDEDYTRQELYAKATAMLAPTMPTLDALHRLALAATPERWSSLGIFMSAGYQLVPERTIRYDLDLPKLSFLGINLCGKHLIIDGSAYSYVGAWMIGTLEIRGTAGSDVGYAMTGAYRGNPSAIAVVGDNNGKWNVAEKHRAAFLHAITNPERLTYKALHDSIIHRYYGVQE